MAGTGDAQDDVITLYSKPGCCLCDDAKPLVHAAAAAHGLTVQVVSILQDAALMEQFRWRIPVVTYRGQVLDEGRVSGDRLAAALRRVQRQRAGSSDGPR